MTGSASMRVPTSKLLQLAIFTSGCTGAGIATMYYLMQKNFAQSDYHRLAVEKLEACPVAMENLGAPPLKVYNLHLSDRTNQISPHWAQIKIPVRGSRTGGYLYTTSARDTDSNRWILKLAVLQLKDGTTFDLLTPPPNSSPQETAPTDFTES